jgi:ABC-2 type transport system permease protein
MSMILVTIFSVLLLSNLITALSVFYLSDELQLLLASPQPLGRIYLYKCFETLILSSWMVFLFVFPVLAAFGWVFSAPFSFYIVLMGFLVPYLMIPTALGVMVAMLVVKAFPARRMQDIFFLLTAVIISGLYLLFRFLQPEKLVNPEAFAALTQYLASLSTPAPPYLPTSWMTELLMMLLVRTGTDLLFLGSLLVMTALAFWIIGGWVASSIYFEGWSKAQEARHVLLSGTPFLDRLFSPILKRTSASMGALLRKDIKTFFRTTTQWSQLLLLGALVIVYIYNFKILPLRISPISSIFFQNVLAFLNMGLAAFVLTAIAVRLVYPAISMEGPAFWILCSAPCSLRQVWWSKFWLGVVPLSVLALILVVLTNYFLGVSTFIMLLSSVTILGLSIGICSLGMLLGSRYPKFEATNPIQISMGFGGIVYMILGMLYSGIIIILEAGPVYIMLWNQWIGREIGTGLQIEIASALGAIFMLQMAFVIVTTRMGLRAIQSLKA